MINILIYVHNRGAYARKKLQFSRNKSTADLYKYENAK